jgi:hypothetical protein
VSVLVSLRNRRRIVAQLPFLSIVAVVLGVVLYLSIEPGHWRRGCAVIAAAMLGGAVLRLVLPAPKAGLLAVRGRYWDTLCYAVLGGVILAVDIRLRN